MKLRKIRIHLRYLLLIFAVYLFTLPYGHTQSFSDCYNLYKTKDYFRLNNRINNHNPDLKGWEKLYLEAINHSVFCRYQESNSSISKLLDNYSGDIHDSLKAQIYKSKIYNHVNIFEYSQAADNSDILITNYETYLDEKTFKDAENERKIWSFLKDKKPQEIIRNGDVKIKMKRDMINLWNIPVTLGNTQFDFVFDTGANISVVAESIAKKTGLKLSDIKIQVGTATNIEVESRLAVADAIKVGDVIFKNVVFLVLPDDALTFGPYLIKGIIGVPVMRQFGEIRISDDDNLTSPASPVYKHFSNLAFEEFTPVINIISGKDTLAFIFDSGAQKSMLYYPYFALHEKEIKDKYELIKIKVRGAGGNALFNGYRIKDIPITTGKSTVTLEEINLLAEHGEDRNKTFYGLIGQDYIGHFSEMTINFRDMYIEFKE